MEYFHGIIMPITDKSIIKTWYLKKWEGAKYSLAHTGLKIS